MHKSDFMAGHMNVAHTFAAQICLVFFYFTTPLKKWSKMYVNKGSKGHIEGFCGPYVVHACFKWYSSTFLSKNFCKYLLIL